MKIVLPLEEITPHDRLRVGGKALDLALLTQRGFPVPPAFVVPTEVFVGFLEQAGLLERAQDLARRHDPDEAVRLSSAIVGAPLPESVEEVLVAHAHALGARLAVRSSASEEDGRARSFAGQHLTTLHRAPSAVGQAVRSCWASLYRRSALAYRGVGAPGPRAGGMAVVVQQMILARSSGVLFTINPLNGSWREMTVESTWGLGEGLMEGKQTPHWFLVRRPRPTPRPVQRFLSRVRLQVLGEDLPEIPHRWTWNDEGGTRVEAVPPALKGRPSLDRSTLFRLCRMGLRVEALKGEPQDVEWAVDQAGRPHLLQARPITAAGAPRPRNDVLWTRRFIGERWPEPATPLGWSLMGPILEWFIAHPQTQARHLGGGPALRLVASRPYVNATAFRHLAFKLPGAPALRFALELMPPEEERAWRRRFMVLPDVSVYASFLREALMEARWRRFRFNPLTNPRHWEDFRRRLDEALPLLSRVPRSESDALRLVAAQLEWVREYVGIHVASLLYANVFDQLLELTLAGLLPERAQVLRHDLAVCPPGNLTLETNEALWEVAQEARDGDLEVLRRGEIPDSSFGARLARFLEVFGHRSPASWEVFTPRWREHPEQLVPLLEAQRRHDAEPPAERAAQQELRHRRAREELIASVGWPTRWALAWLVEQTRIYLLLRENQRFHFDRLLYAVQRTLLQLGERLVSRGVLEQRDDLAYLTWPEVQGLVDGELGPDAVPEWVARRRARRERDAKELPPVFLRGDGGPPERADRARLEGLAISSGRVRGRVRILRSPAEAHRLSPGEVLVAHAVDPGWTPLFVHAAALVLEMGSRLSHGAVVAREYRLPAVVNIDNVTARLREGQEVTVDGNRGIVWVHDG